MIQQIGHIDTFIRDHAGNEVRRHHVEGGIDGLDLRHGVGDAPIAEDLLGVPHLDDDVILTVLVLIGDAGDVIRNAKILGQNRDLERADLVGDVAVPGDGVRRGGEQVDALPLHGVGHHIVGDDRGIKAHLGEAAGGQPRPLQIGPGLGAEHFEVLVLTAGGPDHGADDGLAKALGQNRAPLRDQLCQMVAHDLHGGIPAVQGLHRVLHDGLNGVLPCRQRLLGHLRAAIGDLAVAVGGGGAGVGQIVSRLL